jgi:hypothetical protein
LNGGFTASITSRTSSAVNTVDYDFGHKGIPEEAKRSRGGEKDSSKWASAKIRIADGKKQRRRTR